jgi:hypothetical protein
VHIEQRPLAGKSGAQSLEFYLRRLSRYRPALVMPEEKRRANDNGNADCRSQTHREQSEPHFDLPDSSEYTPGVLAPPRPSRLL